MNKTALLLTAFFAFGLSLQAKENAEAWKDKYFKMHPEADTDGDGILSWPELKAHKAKQDSKKVSKEEAEKASKFKDEYFKKHPEADTDKDGKLSWTEFKLHKNSQK